MSRPTVVRTIHRAPAQVIAGLAEAGVSTVHEAIGRSGLLGPAITARQSGTRIAGSAVTVVCHPGDNLMIHAAVEVIAPGDILVVTTTSRSTDGMFGELLACSLRAHGCIGLVTDAGVRDKAELNAMGFPVWSRAVHAQGTVKATPGSVNVPAVCAGQRVEPGDVVVADDDGVCIVGRAEAKSALEAAQARTAREATTRERLVVGDLGLDIYDLRTKLRDLGVTYTDGVDDADAP